MPARSFGVDAESSMVPPRYRETELLARGGMAEVYRAVDRELERPVAIKLLAAADAVDGELRQRFAREALAAARLAGEPHTVTVYDVGEWQGRPYLVMEYLPGGSLEQRLRRGQPAAGQALVWLAQTASALDHAHARGVVHRDLKPANLLFDEDGELHVADFGIASAAGLSALTQTGTVLGTAGYLAPEQAEGKRATAAADRYALAVVAFELLTGQRPYRSESLAVEAAAHLHVDPPSVSARNPDLPVSLDGVFARALAKNPEARHASCAELVASIRAALEPADTPTKRLTTAAPTQPRAARFRPWGRPRFRWVTAAALLVTLAAGAAAALLFTGNAFSPSAGTFTAAATRTITLTTPASTANAGTTRRPTTVATATTLSRHAEALIGARNYQAALPLLQRAARLLQGAGSRQEGRAYYDLAYTLAQLGNCNDAIPLLNTAQTLPAPQPATSQLLAICNGPPGHQPDHGNGNGNSQS